MCQPHHMLCSQLLTDLKTPAEVVEIRLKIKSDEWSAVAGECLAAFEKWIASGQAGDDWVIETPSYEGVRVKSMDASGAQQSWILLRASLHDPLLVVNAESDVVGGTRTAQHASHNAAVFKF